MMEKKGYQGEKEKAGRREVDGEEEEEENEEEEEEHEEEEDGEAGERKIKKK